MREPRHEGEETGARRARITPTTLPADPFEAVLAARARKGEPSGGELGGGELRQVELGLLDPSPRNPRREFAPEPLAELADSIAAVGLIEPLVVTPSGEGRFAVVAGERRLRALCALAAAGKLSPTHPVPVRVLPGLTEAEHVVLSLVENLQRQDLHPLEEAEAFARLRSEHGFTTEQLARQTGRSQRWVQLRLALIDLTPETRLAFAVGELGLTLARRLAPLPAGEQAKALAAVRARPAEESASEALERVVTRVSRPGQEPRSAASRAAHGEQPTGRFAEIHGPLLAKFRLPPVESLSGSLAVALAGSRRVALRLATARLRAARTGESALEVYHGLRGARRGGELFALATELAASLEAAQSRDLLQLAEEVMGDLDGGLPPMPPKGVA